MIKDFDAATPSCKARNGFSLVELLVASAITVIAVVAVVAMARKGQALSISDGHRRSARAIITSQFESTQFNFTNYPNLAPGTTASTVTIDPRTSGTTSDDLNGTLTIVIGAETTLSGANGINVPFKNITMKVAWTEPDEGPDSIVIEKRLSQAQ